SDVRSNGPPLMGEIYHKFTLSATSDVTISHDGSAIDTYMSLLDEWFVIADAYDTGTSAYIRMTLPAGVYFVAAVGVGNSIGVISTTISLPGAFSEPSQNKNYIRTTTYREPFTAVPAAPSVHDAMVEVAYFDGLGRPLQQVSAKASADGQKDLVMPVSYDAFGRQDKNYLPYATGTGSGGEFKENAIPAQENFYNSPPVGVVQIPQAGGVTPSFAQTVFEASPLSRVLEQGAPGAAWQPATTRGTSGRTVLSEHATNNQTDFNLPGTRKVALYGVSLSPAGVATLTLNGAYDANQLYVSITKDEN